MEQTLGAGTLLSLGGGTETEMPRECAKQGTDAEEVMLRALGDGGAGDAAIEFGNEAAADEIIGGTILVADMSCAGNTTDASEGTDTVRVTAVRCPEDGDLLRECNPLLLQPPDGAGDGARPCGEHVRIAACGDDKNLGCVCLPALPDSGKDSIRRPLPPRAGEASRR